MTSKGVLCGALLALGLAASGCDDMPPAPPSTDGGPRIMRDAQLLDVPGLPPPPNTIVPCRAAGSSAPRGLFQVSSTESLRGAVAPGLSFEEIAVAYPSGPSGPSQVAFGTMRSDGTPYADDGPATPDHPRVMSTSVASTWGATVIAYLHSGSPPFRPFAVVRAAGLPDWSAPIPLATTAARSVRVVGSGPNALVFLASEAVGDTPMRLFRVVLEEGGTILSRPELVPGTEGVTAYAATARGTRISLVYDVPSTTSAGRAIVHRTLRNDGALEGDETIVADDRPTSGQPSVLRGPPDETSNGDVVLVAWSQLDGGVSSEVYFARVGEDGFEDLVTKNEATGSDPALAPLIDEWFALFFRSHGGDTIRARVGRPYRTGGLTIDDVFPLRSRSGPLVAAASPDAYGVGLVWTEQTSSGSRVAYGTARCTDRE